MPLVDSEHIQHVDWDGGVLKVTFHSGHQYKYFDVPHGLYGEFLAAADSHSKFFNSEIKGKYEYAKVNPDE